MSVPVQEFIVDKDMIINDDSVSISATGKCKSLFGLRYNMSVPCTIVSIESPNRLTIRFKNPYDGAKESTRTFNQERHCLTVKSTRPAIVLLKAPGVASRVPLIVGAMRTS